jgi:O-antigen biosynthesis protein
LKRILSERLSLASKLRLKRALFAPMAWALRAGARAYNFAVRVRESAEANGLDVRRAWDAPARPRAPEAHAFGAADFLFLSRAADAREADEEDAYESSNVKTSIVIPVFNKVEFTFQCLRSLLREVDFRFAEVVVVDNASTDATRELLSHFRKFVRVVRNEENRGFVDACNQGAAVARGRHLLFLNNDTVVHPGWLGALVETLERDERAGAAGSMFLYPDGRLQEAGAIIWADGGAFHYGWGRSPQDRRFAFAREVDYCSGASLIIRKELFDQLGGFDRRYAPAYYEDADLCMGVRSLGYKVVYQPASRVTHFEGATAGTQTGSGFKRYQVINRDKFKDKWRATLEREHRPYDPSSAERAANRRWDTQVAVFDDRTPTPDRDAGSARMLSILSALSAWCHPVFVATSKQAMPGYERALWREGVETARALDFTRLVRERRFRAAILSRPHVAEGFLTAIRRASPRTRIVFDMVDAHALRLEREHALTRDPATAREAERYRGLESKLARSCDLLWCASTADEEFMSRLAPGVPTVVVPTIHTPRERVAPFEERAHLLFVGNFLHRPNTDAAHFYAREVLPLVRESLPGVELLLVGDNAPPEFAAYVAEGVRVLGHVPDIEPVFARARVSVAPVRFGAGINGKIGEALAHGLPVVTTPIGAAGLGLRDGEEALIASSPEDLAAATVRLYTDAALWRKLSDEGREHVRRHFTPRVVGKLVNDSVRGLLGHFEESLTAPRSAAEAHTSE